MELSTSEVEAIDVALDQDGYFVVRKSELSLLCESARGEYLRFLANSEIQPTRKSFDFRSLVRKPWRKLAIGSRIGLGDPYAQNLQSTYFDPRDASFPNLGDLFRKMLAIRNQLMKVPPHFGEDADRDRFWNACRIHHYPRGGGFMAKHRDTHFPQIIEEQLGKPFYQVSVLLSRKGEDFLTGGGFVEDRNGKKVDLEEEAGFGTMVIFDGRTYHGVDDVDLDQVIDFASWRGRLAAFVNLYAVLSAAAM
jgi:hypothetical protein